MKTLSPRAQEVLAKVVDFLADRLAPDFHLMLERYQRQLWDRIRTEQDPGRRIDWVASREAVDRNGPGFFPAFVASLRDDCQSVVDHSPPAEPALPLGLLDRPLALMDEDAVDEDGALAAMAARLEGRASHPLMLLSQRFAVLLERPPLAAGALPIGPCAMGRGLQRAAREVGLQQHSRVLLYAFFEEDSAALIEAWMQAVDALLDGLGILPGLRYVPLRPRVVPAHPGRGRGHGPAPGQGDGASTDDADGIGSAAEARRASRLPVDAVAPVVDAMTRRALGVTRDISMGGFCVRATAPLVDDALYQVQLALQGRDGARVPIEAGAQVVSQSRGPDGAILAGLRFIHLDGAGKTGLAAWIDGADQPR